MSAERAAELPPEDVYGHAKKVHLFREVIAEEKARKQRRLSVLDFGCGSGDTVARYLIDEALDYVGVDIFQPALAYAKAHFAADNVRLVETIPEGVRFDIIIYGDVLEHIDDPADMLIRHCAFLADDGVIVGSVPNGFGGFENERRIDRLLHLTNIARALLRALRQLRRRPVQAETTDRIPFNEASGHVVFFTRRSLERTIEAAGLTIDRFSHGSFVGADLSGSTFLKNRFLIGLNARIADFLPSWAVSTWHFSARRSGTPQAGSR